MKRTAPDHVLWIGSPVGPLTLAGREGCLTHLLFGEHFAPTKPSDLLENAAGQLAEYFAGTRREFDLPLHMEGTPFQKDVWNALRNIPYGQTVSYGDVARAIGRPKAFRAVGQANHVNPISIIVPCHRVVGHSGSLTGYGGGMSAKELLLALEARVIAAQCAFSR